MRIDDRPEFGGRFQARQQRRGRARRNRQHHGVAGLDRDAIVAEFQFAHAVGRHAERTQFMPELDLGTLALQQLDGGLDQDGAEAIARNQRPPWAGASESSLEVPESISSSRCTVRNHPRVVIELLVVSIGEFYVP